MTAEELEQQNAAAHEAMIADAKARIAEGERRQATRKTHIDHGLAAYKFVKNSRHYAVDPDGESALGALVQAYIEERAERGERGSFSREGFAKEVLQPLAGVLPELIQERPPPEPEPPKAWSDPVTSQYAKNPYAKDSLDLTSQGELEKRDPALASHLKAVASGVSYSYLAKLADEREAREKMRSLPYTEKEHLSNPFLLDKKTGLKPQSQFVKEHEPFVVTFYQREAATIPALPFQAGHRNMTKVMQCHKLSPQIAAVITRAEKIYNDHRAAELQRLEEAAKSAEAELQRVRERTAKS